MSTRRTFARSFGLVSMVVLLVGAAAAPAPKVIETVPKSGDRSVDPELTELRVTFDTDMAGGFSFTGGGEMFPEVAGTPRWIDRRTCVLPVKLFPGRSYRLGINSASARNFRSQAGVSAAPIVWTFRTAGPAEPVDAAQIEKNTAALTELQRLMQSSYSYSRRLGIDWSAAIEAQRATLEKSSPSAFAEVLGELLAQAKDIHIRVGTGDALSQVYSPGATPNIDVRQLGSVVPGWKQLGKTTATGKYPDGVVYVLIAAWSNKDDVEAAIREIGDAARAVIDVRPNGGGDELLARAVAGRFVSKPVVYARHRTLDNGTWSDIRDRVLQPAGTLVEGRKVVVLQGPANFSSNESFLQMMLAAGATTVGAKTGGSSGNPKVHDLGNGVKVALPSWEALGMDGSVIEGVGLSPGVEVKFVPPGDPVLDKALELVRR